MEVIYLTRIFLSFFLLYISLGHQTSHAATLTLEKCITLLNKEIHEDLYISFPELKNIQENEGWKYTYEDIERMVSESKSRDRKLESLIKLYRGTSLGEKHLFILKDQKAKDISEATHGYIYYKELNGTNILLEIKQTKKKWKVVKKQIGRGRYITLRDINKECMISY